ncbi:MAG: serine protease [Gemmatimonadota bacterium]
MATEHGPQAYYQTAYPEHDTSRDLERVFASVKQISFTAEYRTYVFRPEAGMTEADVRAGRFRARADSSFGESLSKAGTATIIARSGTRVTLLTTDHVVHLPELRISYYDEGPGRNRSEGPRVVASASVLTSERGTLVPHPGRGPLQVLARDEQNDLALLGMELGTLSDTTLFPALALRTGNPRRLSWGSFLYVLGYPAGYRMVTRSIVSNPNWNGRGGFISDGLWNEGISGGLILAVRSETGRLEPVGLARAGAATSELRLQPDTLSTAAGAETHRYQGMLYVESVLRIQYGITLPVSMTAVTDFIDRTRSTLRARGYF